MQKFDLDRKLKGDTFELGRLNGQILLLMNNSLVPWFILVPLTSKTEIFQLDESERNMIYKNINILSEHILRHFDAHKINIGAIGNVVRQLHVHIIGRREDDFAWPGVIWGRSETEPYTPEQVESVSSAILSNISDFAPDGHPWT